jgi:hypothetical protein
VRLAEDFSQHPKSLAHPSLAAQDDGGPDVLLSDGTKTRDWIAEGRLVRNVIAALRRALTEHADGCRESSLWHGVEARGVARRVFDEAIVIMLNTGWSNRRYGRLFAGAPAMGKPRLAISSYEDTHTRARLQRFYKKARSRFFRPIQPVGSERRSRPGGVLKT